VIGDGECCAVVGPTGCGKSSTTLILVSGLDATTGEVLVHSEPVRGIGKDIGFMFQNDARLLVEDGAGQRAGGSEVRGRPMKQARTEGRDWLRRVGLAGFEDRYPHQLAAGIERACKAASGQLHNQNRSFTLPLSRKETTRPSRFRTPQRRVS